ncbi:MAG: hypothetical protein ABW328_15855 [Ilumatobacteraceae bacterium]
MTAWLADAQCDEDTKHDVVLAASELVTRTVNACTGPPVLLAVVRAGRVRLQIDSTEVLERPGGGEARHRLSSSVLRAVCEDWGVESSSTATSMWAELTC